MGIELEHLEEQVLLTGTVLIQRRLGEADLPGDVIHGGVLKAPLAKQPQRHTGDLLPTPVELRTHLGHLRNIQRVEELLLAVKIEIDGGGRDVCLVGDINNLGLGITLA